jgi:hypothetical protein
MQAVCSGELGELLTQPLQAWIGHQGGDHAQPLTL